MIMLIATFIIAISYVVFFILFANIFTLLLMDIPATIKLGRIGVLKYKSVLKNNITKILIYSVIILVISIFTYYFFIKYSFGFSISIFIGACLALITALWKMTWLFFQHSDNYSKWLDFYLKENIQYLNISDKATIVEKLKSEYKK